MTAALRVGAVVVNYRTPAATLRALDSLHASEYPIHTRVAIDNGSGDDSADRLARLPDVECLRLSDNLGFAGGANVGIRHVLSRGCHLVLLLNSDATLPPPSLARLVAALTTTDRVGVTGPLIFSEEPPATLVSAGISFSSATGRMRHIVPRTPLDPLRPVPVDAVSGCAMLIRREVFEHVGLLDEAYFFTFEDLDFCLRARRAGYETVCARDAVVLHEGSRSIGRRSPARVYFATRNHFRLAARTAPLGSPLHAGFRHLAILTLNLAYTLFRSEAPLPAGLVAFGRGYWHHLRGRYGPFPA